MTPYTRFHVLIVSMSLAGAAIALSANPLIRHRTLALFTDQPPPVSDCRIAVNLARQAAVLRDQGASAAEFESRIALQPPPFQPLLRYTARKSFREYRRFTPDEAAAAETTLCRRNAVLP
jgi:hypothetical protein